MAVRVYGKAAVFLLISLSLYLAVILFTGGSTALPASHSAFISPPTDPPMHFGKVAANIQSQASLFIKNPEETDLVTVSQGTRIKVIYDMSAGTADFYWQGRKVISSFYSTVKLPGLVTSKDYTSRTISTNGNLCTVISTNDQYPTMKQQFRLIDEDSFSVSLEMDGSGLSSNYMAPVVMNDAGGVDLGQSSDARALWIPFDNDRDVKYDAASINTEDTSYEVAAFYDNTGRNGLVVGSITHDTWKTGVHYVGSENRLDLLDIFGGVSIRNDKHDGTMVRDVRQHGAVNGDVLISPEIFVGFFTDWRDGLEAFADANAARVPMREWQGGVPFGWNSWGAVGSSLNTEKALAASDFMETLQHQGFSDNEAVYVNLDSYWDSSAMDLVGFVKAVKEKGQKAGIYWAPFVDWAKDPNRPAEGTQYTYQELWLKGDNGRPVTYQDDAYALDPTHPGTLERMDFYIDSFKSMGFDAYIKLDFLTCAALEGKHYDKSVTTGIQAFHKGMAYLTDAILHKLGPDTFISEAISPLFPYQYAHARRISCDKFGYLYESRDLLNASAYGWWMSGRLYRFNDPDHLVLTRTWWNPGVKISENEAKTRVTSALVTGAPLLAGDDFSDPDARRRAMRYLANARINAQLREGRAFRPVEGNTGTASPDWFVLDNGDGSWDLAFFNWDAENPASITVDLERAGLDPTQAYSAVEQWSGSLRQVMGQMTVNLEAGEAKLFKINKLGQ